MRSSRPAGAASVLPVGASLGLGSMSHDGGVTEEWIDAGMREIDVANAGGTDLSGLGRRTVARVSFAAAVPVLAQLGASDCERLGSGLLAQPVNAASSLVYVGVGLAIALSASRRPELGARSYLFAGLVAAIGLGSVAFHGPQPVGARLLHDLPIVVALLFIGLDGLHRRRPRPGRFNRGLVGGTAAAALLAAAWPDGVMALTGLLVLAVVATEVELYRREVRPLSRPAQLRAYAAIAAILAVGSVFFWLGRSGNPLCDPTAPVQWHGAWHVVSSAAFAAWWWLAFAATSDGRPAAWPREPAPPVDHPA